METMIEKKVDTMIERMMEEGRCLGCTTPIEKLTHKSKVGIEYYECPNCGTMVTKNSVKFHIPDPDIKRRNFEGWKV